MGRMALSVVACCALLALPVEADVIFGHYGATDPETEGWDADPEVGTSVTPVGPILDDGGYDAWFINDVVSSSSGSSGGYWGVLDETQSTQAATDGWKLRTTVRVANVPDVGYGSVAVYFFDGATQWYLDFETDATGQQIVTAVTALGFAGIDYNSGSGGYHSYEIVYDPLAGNADVFVDGVEQISDWEGMSTAINENRFKFGSGCSLDVGQGNYSLVEFEIVPEPATLTLLALGALAALRRRRG